jgi:hypothetical protein
MTRNTTPTFDIPSGPIDFGTSMFGVGTTGIKDWGTELSLPETKTACTLPAPETAPTITIDQMKADLRIADCLYDKNEIWKQLGAKEVPAIPDTVIQEAYEKGGRVVLKCSSVSEKADALRAAGRDVYFGGIAEQYHYAKNVSNPEWIVVQSHIDRNTLGSPKSKVVTSEMPAPTPADWFSAIAYAKLDGGRQPKGCESLWAFTTESGTVVGSRDAHIGVYRSVDFVHRGSSDVGAARFGRPRN